ncbi:hypothetical protein BDW59DRAFT_159653 [Aspergillus cavernicola]|uniref:beta-glucosidase n=1 Tax=Aspergillus cavernicola TaxID=176166 RepID=A0ABR4INH5_9EURO
MTDWGAVSTVDSVANGLDLEMPGPARMHESSLVYQALKHDRVNESNIDDRVRRYLQLLDRVGKFTNHKSTSSEEKAVDKPENRALIREARAAGIVLLRNRDNILVIDMASTKKIAVLGTLANVPSAHGGGSASMACHYKVNLVGAFDVEVWELGGICVAMSIEPFLIFWRESLQPMATLGFS